VRGRDPEHGHDRIADELFHGPPVPLERLPGFGEVTLHHAPQGLRIEPFPERR